MNYFESGDDFEAIKHSTENSGTVFHLITLFCNPIIQNVYI